MTVLYGNDAFSILVLSTTKRSSTFLEKAFVFQKIFFKGKDTHREKVEPNKPSTLLKRMNIDIWVSWYIKSTFYKRFINWIKIFLKSEAVTGKTPFRQGNYCNNLATRVIPFFIVSKSSVGETISKAILPHFSKDPVA